MAQARAGNRYRIVASEDGRRRVESSLLFNTGMAGGNTLIGGMMSNAGTYYGMLEGILMESEHILQAIYEDIYDYDVSCGTTVDLRATLVSSGFTMTGVKEKDLEVYQTALNRLGFPKILPQMYLDKYVRGKFISTLLYNRNKKEFSNQIVHSAKDCTILNNPLYNGKPVIKFRPPESMIEFFKDDSELAKNTRNRMNPDMVKLLSDSGLVELDDLLTIYVPRPAITGRASGTSMFRRVVPIYILEKILYRGTISEAQRRQRAIMHITAGNENWTPVDSEMQMLVAMFQQADLDPVGAILATRNDVNVQDVRQGGDFWKWTDVADYTGQMKLRALGVSEAFLSGETTYSSMEVSLSVFLENLRADREYVTNAVFDTHLFPLIAHVNDMVAPDKRLKETAYQRGVGKSRGRLTGNTEFDIGDPSNYRIPKINWDKSLRPEADSEYLQTLDQLAEKGVPISLSMIAAAGGISIDEVLSHQDKELEMMKRIKKYKEKMEEIGDFGNDEELASYRDKMGKRIEKLEATLKSAPKSILNRGWEQEETSEVFQGKKRHVPSARASRERNRQKDTAKKVIQTLSRDDLAWERSRKAARAFQSKAR